MLPVAADLVSIIESFVTGNHRFIGNDHHRRGIQAAADPLADLLARHRVTISAHTDQAGVGGPHRAFDLTIKGGQH